MRTLSGFAVLLVLAVTLTNTRAPATTAPDALPAADAVEVVGKTQCLIGKRIVIAPVVLHPVEEVLVAPGDRVKKGQVLIKLDADEPQADVRAKEAVLTSAQVALKDARRHLEATDRLAQTGALPEQKHHEARVAVLKSEADERAAIAALDSAKAELEHYTMTAMSDGVVGELSVHPGSVPWPGRTVWGEILDLSEIDVRCELSADQVDHVQLGQSAEIRRMGKKDVCAVGKVVYVGLRADDTSGLVPVHIRIANADNRLRCGIEVRVRIASLSGTAAKQ
jgi:RND family efflux transporter MFP subunit